MLILATVRSRRLFCDVMCAFAKRATMSVVLEFPCARGLLVQELSQ